MFAREPLRSSFKQKKSVSTLRVSGTSAFILARFEARQGGATGRTVTRAYQGRAAPRPRLKHNPSKIISAQVTFSKSSGSLVATVEGQNTQRSSSINDERISLQSILPDHENMTTARVIDRSMPDRQVPVLSLTSLSQTLTELEIETGRQSNEPTPFLTPSRTTLIHSGERRERGAIHERTQVAAPARRQVSRRSVPAETRGVSGSDRCLTRYCTALWLTRAAQTRDLSRRSVADGTATSGAVARQIRAMVRRIASYWQLSAACFISTGPN